MSRRILTLCALPQMHILLEKQGIPALALTYGLCQSSPTMANLFMGRHLRVQCELLRKEAEGIVEDGRRAGGYGLLPCAGPQRPCSGAGVSAITNTISKVLKEGMEGFRRKKGRRREPRVLLERHQSYIDGVLLGTEGGLQTGKQKHNGITISNVSALMSFPP